MITNTLTVQFYSLLFNLNLRVSAGMNPPKFTRRRDLAGLRRARKRIKKG